MDFKIGEIAIFVGSGDLTKTAGYLHKYLGEECTINAYPAELPALARLIATPGLERYEIEFKDGRISYVLETSLRKRRPPEQPADDQEFISWFNRVIKKEPLEADLEKTTLSTANPKAWDGWRIEVLGNGS